MAKKRKKSIFTFSQLHIYIVIGVLVLSGFFFLRSSKDTKAITQYNQGLIGAWAVDDSGNIDFPHSTNSQLNLIKNAKAGWIRINFRLGACFPDWTSVGCNGKTALQQYDTLIANAQSKGLKVLGLLSNEAWAPQTKTQIDWTENNAENNPSGNGDNVFLQDFSQKAAVVLTQHFQGKITMWEVWNEPNCWGENPAPGVFTGCSYIYPSNFAWLLRHVYEDTKTAGITNVSFVSGGLLGIDASGSGASYLTQTYQQGKDKAGWDSIKQTYGTYPLDHIGQHIYVDDQTTTTSTKLKSFVTEIRNAYVAFEGTSTDKKIVISEFGWNTQSLSETVQSNNLKTAYNTFKTIGYIFNSYWNNAQDIPEAGGFWGLQTGGSSSDNYTGTPKKSFSTYQRFASF